MTLRARAAARARERCPRGTSWSPTGSVVTYGRAVLPHGLATTLDRHGAEYSPQVSRPALTLLKAGAYRDLLTLVWPRCSLARLESAQAPHLDHRGRRARAGRGDGCLAHPEQGHARSH